MTFAGMESMPSALRPPGMPPNPKAPRGSLAFVRAITLSVLGAALGGCMVGPDFKTPQVAVPAIWSAQSDARIATQAAIDGLWWRVFQDPALDHLIELAYRQNLPLQVAGLRIVQARAQLGVATGAQFPQVQELFASAAAVGLTQQGANLVSPDQQTRNFFAYQAGFDATWEIDFWGKYRRGVQAEAATLLASVADYYAALVSLTAEVARTYAVMRTFDVLVDQARDNVRIQEQGLRMAESRLRNGATTELDVTQATTLLEGTRATIPQLELSAQQARNALSTLLGQPTGTIDALLEGPKEIPRAPPQVTVSVPADLLRRRPDIRSAELYAAAQCARIGVAKADLYPSFSLFGTFGLGAVSTGIASHNLFSGQSLFYNVGPQVNWPVLNYGRIENNVRVQDARFQQLLVDYRNTVLKAAQEVEDALVGFLKSKDAVGFEENSVKAAQRSVEIAASAYQEGAVDYQRVLDAQRSLLREETALTQTRSAVATNLVALYKALGGGWELSRGQPVVPAATQAEMKERTNWGDMLSTPRHTEVRTPAAAP
jgi:NodT family efflux transporter outer membrane factor (OMF) lipoprotein